MVGLIDSHVHLDDKRFAGEIPQLIDRAKKAGVAEMIQIGIDLRTSKIAIELSEKHPEIYPVVGFHPNELASYEDHEEKLIELAQGEEVVAIGEIGLDYHWDKYSREKQKELFLRQIDIAKNLNKPIVIHNRDAHQDTMDILRQEHKYLPGGVLHCFSGSWEMAKMCLRWGFYISFAGPLTFPKSNKLREIATNVPNDRVLIETDCPYLAPQAFRGKRNEPAYVVEQAKMLAQLKGLDYQEVARLTRENTIRLFNLKDD
ncbi:MAG: TatD family hydrolase [Firmicutes bacterium]|jgi:TatD DNase family protein|nr:TatD family hydrolase [Bacillota bacterium]